MLTTWTDVKAQLAEIFGLTQDRASSVTVRQGTRRVRIDHEDRSLVVRAEVCREREVPPRAALVCNDSLVAGTLSLDDGVCFLRGRVALDADWRVRLEALLDEAAAAGARLLAQVSRAHVEALAIYAD